MDVSGSTSTSKTCKLQGVISVLLILAMNAVFGVPDRLQGLPEKCILCFFIQCSLHCFYCHSVSGVASGEATAASGWLGGLVMRTCDLRLLAAGSILSHDTAWLFLR